MAFFPSSRLSGQVLMQENIEELVMLFILNAVKFYFKSVTEIIFRYT